MNNYEIIKLFSWSKYSLNEKNESRIKNNKKYEFFILISKWEIYMSLTFSCKNNKI